MVRACNRRMLWSSLITIHLVSTVDNLILWISLCDQSRPTLCDPEDCSPPFSWQEDWSELPFPTRGSSRFRNWSRVSCVGRRILDHLGPPWKFNPVINVYLMLTTSLCDPWDSLVVWSSFYSKFLRKHFWEGLLSSCIVAFTCQC